MSPFGKAVDIDDFKKRFFPAYSESVQIHKDEFININRNTRQKIEEDVREQRREKNNMNDKTTQEDCPVSNYVSYLL